MRIRFAVALATLGIAASTGAAGLPASPAPMLSADAPAASADASATSADASAIRAAQIARLNAKLWLVEQVVGAAEKSDPASMTPERRRWMRESLYAFSLEQLRAIGVPGGFDAVRKTITANDLPQLKALGSTTTDLVYRPITPCRYIDTRVLGTPVEPPPVGSLLVDLAKTGASYGGSGGCNVLTASGLPNASEIAAVFMNVGIVNPQFAPGFFGARPAGSSNSTSLVNWYQAGAGVQASDAAAVATSGGATGTNQVEFFGTPTDLVVDILGVFTRPDATALDCTTVVQTGVGTNNVPTGSVFNDFAVAPSCLSSSYTIVSVGCEYGPTPPSGLELSSSAGDPGAGFFACVWVNNSGSTLSKSSFHVSSRCCRVPGR
jgi:hypothetical protein